MNRLSVSFLPLILTAVLLHACAPSTRLSTVKVEHPPTEGAYHLLLHGCNYTNDPNTIAFFWPATQDYTFKPYSPAFQYRLIENLLLPEALSQARDFVICSPHFDGTRLSAVKDRQDGVLGYELRPLYFQPSPLLRRDLLHVSYRFMDAQTIRVNITPLSDLDDDDQDND